MKATEFHIFFNRTAVKIGLPWVIRAGTKVWGASHVVLSGPIKTFEGPFSTEKPRFSIVALGTLRMRGTEAWIEAKDPKAPLDRSSRRRPGRAANS